MGDFRGRVLGVCYWVKDRAIAFDGKKGPTACGRPSARAGKQSTRTEVPTLVTQSQTDARTQITQIQTDASTYTQTYDADRGPDCPHADPDKSKVKTAQASAIGDEPKVKTKNAIRHARRKEAQEVRKRLAHRGVASSSGYPYQ